MENTTDPVTRVPPEKNRGGVWVRFGDEEFKVPALGLLGVQELIEDIPKLQGITGVPTREQMNMVAVITQKAMRRNYPNLSVDDVSDMLDMSNFADVLNSVMSVSGFVRAQPGSTAPGETKASTGMSSTSA